jgi:hypothetical protein
MSIYSLVSFSARTIEQKSSLPRAPGVQNDFLERKDQRAVDVLHGVVQLKHNLTIAEKAPASTQGSACT